MQTRNSMLFQLNFCRFFCWEHYFLSNWQIQITFIFDSGVVHIPIELAIYKKYNLFIYKTKLSELGDSELGSRVVANKPKPKVYGQGKFFNSLNWSLTSVDVGC